MNSQELVNWHFQEDISVESTYQNSNSLVSFFRSSLGQLDEQEMRKETFVVDIFHSLVGLKLIGVELQEYQKTKVQSFIMDCWTGKGFTPVVEKSRLANLLRTQKLPEDLYSTYYSLGALLLVGQDIAEYLEGVADNLSSYFQSSGWVYDSSWSETSIERRFDIELTQQSLMGMRLSVLLDLSPQSRPYHCARREQLLNYLKTPRYITSIHYAVQCLILMEEWDSNREAIEGQLCQFVMDHFEEEERGFREYQFQNVKVFRYRGMAEGEKGAYSKHRYHSDSLTSSINATTYAVSIGLKVGQSLLASIREKKHAISAFFDDQRPHKSGGYGTPVMIAKYRTPFGPEVTAVETCNYIVGKYMVNELI